MENNLKIKILAAKYVYADAMDLPTAKDCLKRFSKVRRIYFGNLDEHFPCYWTSAVSVIGGNPWGTIDEAKQKAEEILKRYA